MNITFRAALLTLAAALTLAPAAQAELREKTIVRLPERFIVDGEHSPQILLGELAEKIEGGDPALCEALRKLPVAEVPESGEKGRLSPIKVLRDIRAAGLDYLSVDLQGARLIEVFGDGQTIAPATMVEELKKHILRESGWTEDEVSMRVLSSPAETVWLPTGEVGMYVNRLTDQYQGTARYDVEFYINQIQVGKAPFIVATEHKRTVYVPTGNLNRGDVISAGDLGQRVIYVDNQQIDQQLADDPEALVGSRVKTPLHKNEPIRWFEIETNFVLQRGNKATMVVRTGGLTMHTSVKAEKRAALGDVIPVKTEDTKQIVFAKVLASDLVEFVR
ncbi:MAG: flagellar basal body P-ring formation protein FlgA [bacterium]|nr:flagellar basal body P-ring formation protein FlgA [bacterium]